MRQERGKTNGEPLKRIVHPSDFSQSSRVAFCHASKSPSSPTPIRRLSSSRERPLESLAATVQNIRRICWCSQRASARA